MEFFGGTILLVVLAIALWKSDSQSQQNGNSNEKKS